ncbi:MAG: hypothetical protein KJ607_07870, partial [Bacteroidetes bacterium]|nr:hypothetical protein [Bacteroidota bacterium]
RLFLTATGILLSLPFTFSQAIDKGDMFLGAGAGPAINTVGIVNYSLAPAFRLTCEKGIFVIEPGIVTIGAVVGLLHQSDAGVEYFKYTSAGTKVYSVTRNYISTVIGVRSGWYYNFAQLGIRELNAYAGASIGVRAVWCYDTNSSGTKHENYVPPSNAVYPHFSGFVGALYHFNANFAVFAEVGYDISWSTAGIILKLN